MVEPLRVLVPGVAWPMETFLDRLLRGLAGQGMQITLASERKPPDAWMQATRAEWLPAPMWRGLSATALWHLGGNTIRSLLVAQMDTQKVWREIIKNPDRSVQLKNWQILAPFTGRRWDVIYFPWNSHAITYLPLFSLGMPVVLSCRGAQVNIAPYNPRRSELREGLKLTFEKATLVHCVSHAILEEAIGLGLDRDKARIIYPAVDPEFFGPLPQPRASDGILRIITTGSLIWRKGLEYALLAVRQVKDQGVPVNFEIIGDGPELQRVRYTIEDLDLQLNVTLIGKQSPDMVRNRLQQADVFMLSSLSEGISNAVLEAMACGLPVVTSDCGGMREAVTDGVEGFVTPLRDPAAVATKLLHLYQNLDLRYGMGQAGRQKVIQQHHLATQIAHFRSLFHEAVSHG